MLLWHPAATYFALFMGYRNGGMHYIFFQAGKSLRRCFANEDIVKESEIMFDRRDPWEVIGEPG